MERSAHADDGEIEQQNPNLKGGEQNKNSKEMVSLCAGSSPCGSRLSGIAKGAPIVFSCFEDKKIFMENQKII